MIHFNKKDTIFMNEKNLTHFDASGSAVMVDVSEKPVTARQAVARGIITMNAAAFAAVRDGTAQKGDVLGVARIAGIMAAKRTSELIPLCHPLPLSKLTVDFHLLPEQQAVEAVCTARTIGVTVLRSPVRAAKPASKSTSHRAVDCLKSRLNALKKSVWTV